MFRKLDTKRMRAPLRRGISWASLLALAVMLAVTNGQHAAAMSIDTFESTESPDGFASNTVFKVVTDPVGSFPGAPGSIAEDNLTGVIGGATTIRTTEVVRTAGIGPQLVRAYIIPTEGRLAFGTNFSVTAKLNLSYALSSVVDLTDFAAITIPLMDVELTGAGTAIPVMTTLTDANGKKAFAMSEMNAEGDYTLSIPSASFTGLDTLAALDLTKINRIEFMFETLAPAQEFSVLGSDVRINAATPEPGTLVLLLIGLGSVATMRRRRRR